MLRATSTTVCFFTDTKYKHADKSAAANDIQIMKEPIIFLLEPKWLSNKRTAYAVQVVPFLVKNRINLVASLFNTYLNQSKTCSVPIQLNVPLI